jgi:multicomponent Na+:H+ antiporter subunit B
VIVALELVMYAVLVLTAILALRVRNLLTAVVLLTAYSLFAALLFSGMGAVDVGLVEGALGAGLTGVLFLAAVMTTSSEARGNVDRRRRWIALPLVVGFVGLLLFASSSLPNRGDPDAPARDGVAATYLADSLADTETPNVVTALLADYRSQDTLGETVVILTAALAAALVLARRPDRPDRPSRQVVWQEDEPGARPTDGEEDA